MKVSIDVASRGIRHSMTGDGFCIRYTLQVNPTDVITFTPLALAPYLAPCISIVTIIPARERRAARHTRVSDLLATHPL